MKPASSTLHRRGGTGSSSSSGSGSGVIVVAPAVVHAPAAVPSSPSSSPRRRRRRGPSRSGAVAWTVCTLAVLGGLAAAGFFLYPRVNIEVTMSDDSRDGNGATVLSALQHYDGPAGASGGPLPYFVVTAGRFITITNPNYVPFSLVNLSLSLWHDDDAAGREGDDDLPLVTLRAQGRDGSSGSGGGSGAGDDSFIVTVPAGSPSKPGRATFLVAMRVSTNDADRVHIAPAMRCARVLFGPDGVCRLRAVVAAQPVYLGLGAGLIPRQTFELVMVVRAPALDAVAGKSSTTTLGS
jgi:hypothetical protein